MTPTLEQLAAQTAEKIVAYTGFGQALHVNDILPDIREALQTATAQQAPTQGGDWAEAAAKEIHATPYDLAAIARGDNGESVTAAIIRRHAPQPDLASVREAVRKACAPEIAEDGQVFQRIMSALTPLLGANADKERLDWLEAHPFVQLKNFDAHDPAAKWSCGGHYAGSPRQAIDAAMGHKGNA